MLLIKDDKLKKILGFIINLTEKENFLCDNELFFNLLKQNVNN
jgi:hypothetical protein